MKSTVSQGGKMQIEEIGNLWCGADFIFINQRYCILEINPDEEEVIAVKIIYDEPIVTGNPIVNFNSSEKVEYCLRSTILRGSPK